MYCLLRTLWPPLSELLSARALLSAIWAGKEVLAELRMIARPKAWWNSDGWGRTSSVRGAARAILEAGRRSA